MKSNHVLLLNHIDYEIPNTHLHFKDICLAFNEGDKVGIVGQNGVGKTTLFKLIMGDLTPISGTLKCTGNISYIPQDLSCYRDQNIAKVLGVDLKLDALKAISEGKTDAIYFEHISDDWNIESKIEQYLHEANLSHIDLNSPFFNLSGGQQTQILLLKIKLSQSHFILFDEPTNNLDSRARDQLYQFISNTPLTILTISHDRILLDLMSSIIEIKQKGVQVYTGNYTHYQEQRNIMALSLKADMDKASEALKSKKRLAQETREKFERKQSKGLKAARSGNMDKSTALSKKGRSEKTGSRLSRIEDRLLNDAQSALDQVKSKVEIEIPFNINLSSTAIPTDKMIVEMKNICFSYEKNAPILHNVNLNIYGPDRVAFVGPNGSGKSTLVKLILKILNPTSGQLNIGTDKIGYLNQHVENLERDKTLLENFQTSNPEMTLQDAHMILASFKFRNKLAHKTVKHLSGGEKIRAGLACMLMSKIPPQLIILDEPTNHLDIHSIECIEAALLAFKGAIITISHDEYFLKNIHIHKTLKMSDLHLISHK